MAGLSGCALFTAQATVFVESLPFLIKIPAIFSAVGIAGVVQRQLRQNAEEWDNGATVSVATKLLAAGSIALWLVAIVAGRLIAYL